MLPICKIPEQDSIKVPRRNIEDICRDLTHSPFRRLGKLHSMVRVRPHVYITYFETPTSSFWDNIVVSCESTIVSPFLFVALFGTLLITGFRGSPYVEFAILYSPKSAKLWVDIGNVQEETSTNLSRECL